jgi:type VI secretion system protein ImpF
MPTIHKNKKLRASILDRLLDDGATRSSDEGSAQQNLKQLRQSVRRDLENLLNTRLRVTEPDERYIEINKSVLNYGLPDLATVNIIDKEKKQEFITQLENLLLTYEPRFKSVSVQQLENADSSDRTLNFRIDAVLYADPAPAVIVLNSVLEPVSRSVNIQEADHA